MTDKKRRQFVTFMGASTVAIPVSALITSLPSHADDAPMVDPASAAAVNWEYVAESTNPDAKCGGCALYQSDADTAAGPCALFPGSNVNSAGWCKAFNARTS